MKEKTKDKLLEFLIQLLFLTVGYVFIVFIKNEILISFIVIALLLINFLIKYVRGEWWLFIFGVIVGFSIEVSTSYFYNLQYWSEGSLFGLPYWLPLIWGYAFVFIRRIGNLFIKKIDYSKFYKFLD